MGKVRLVATRQIHSGAVSLRMDKFTINGRVVEKEIVEHQPSVGIVAVADMNSVLLVTQYRRAAGRTLLEIPAGKVEKGETPVQAARREMAEEIGCRGTLKPLMSWYLAPGYDTEFMRVFVATALQKIAMRGKLDDDEDISVKTLKLDEAIQKCFTGEIRDCKTVAALMAYKQTAVSKKSR